MTSRDILAALAGALLALCVTAAGLHLDRGIVGPALAQPQTQAPREMTTEQLRNMSVAIALALASVAVDGERTAVAQNNTSDRVADLAERLGNLEKRVAELEKKR